MKPIPLPLTALIALFSALVALAVSNPHGGHDHEHGHGHTTAHVHR